MATLQGTNAGDIITPTATADAITGLQGDDVIVYSRAGNTHVDIVTDFGSQYFFASLTGFQENPPIFSLANGQLIGILRKGGGAFNFSVTATGIDFGGQTSQPGDDLIAGHFHRGVIGVNGPIHYGFFGLPNHELDGDTTFVRGSGVGGTISGQWDAAEGASPTTTLTALLAALRAGETYVNLHTTQFPGGEIRGQILAQDQGRDRVDLRGANIEDFATLQIFLGTSAGSAEIVTRLNGQTHTLRLLDVPLAELSANDFIFATAPVNETISGAAGADDLFGAGGNDEVFGLAGDDRLFGGTGDDGLFGGDGADLGSGGAGADRLYGGAGADVLLGGAGADLLNGEADADTLFGGDDADTLSGEAGADTLNGEAGNDVLIGGAEGDTLSGELGADVLVGEAGGDVMIGGAGADSFIYVSVSDSTAGASDLITDFERGVDRIDLSRIDANSATAGDQAFTIVGAFSNVAGQARLVFDSATGRTTLSGDINGDGVADLVIVIVGNVGAGDGFIL